MAKKATKRKPNAAFMKPVQPSDKLAEVVGSKAIPRTEVTKKLWAYIKKNGLQDKKNKRMIKADDNLKAVFGGKATRRPGLPGASLFLPPEVNSLLHEPTPFSSATISAVRRQRLRRADLRDR